GGDAERAGDDRGVARRSAARRAQALHLARIERGGLAWAELLRDQDRARRTLDRPARHAGEQPQHPAPDIADVACPLPQQGARERLEPGGVARVRFAPRVRAAPSVRQPGDGEIDQLGIGEQLEMSIEYLRRSPDVGRPLGFDLLPGALERDVEVRALALDAGAPLLDVDRGAPQLRDLA